MTPRFFIPCDAAAIAVDADRVAEALQAAADARGITIDIVRTGSRGLHWLEPLVEHDTRDGRIAYGPVVPDDATGVLEAALVGAAHPLCHGLTEALPFFAKQARLTFARCGIVDPRSLEDYIAHGGYRGLAAALDVGPAAIVAAVTESGLRGRGGAGFPTGIKWDTVAKAQGDRK